MESKNLNSTRVKKIYYIKEEETLGVEFTDGRTYEYDDVPWGIYTDFAYAKSPGKFFDSKIRGKYSFERM